jgi:hypothetical protein
MMRVLEEGVLPMTKKLHERVHYVLVKHANSWWCSDSIADWRVVRLSPNEDPYMREPEIRDWQRGEADRRRRARQFEGI